MECVNEATAHGYWAQSRSLPLAHLNAASAWPFFPSEFERPASLFGVKCEARGRPSHEGR